MASNTKAELVEKTYELLKTLPPSEIKIRMVADACSCSNATVYRHFKDLDDLVCFASVRYLEDYINKIQKMLSELQDPMDFLVTSWKVFAEIAFRNIDVYLEMFWGRYKDRLGDAIFDYYQEFTKKWNNMDGLAASIFFNNDMDQRNYILVRRASAMGYFAYQDVQIISDLQCYLIHGSLAAYQSCYRQPGKAEEGIAHFSQRLDSLCSHYRIK